jgi:hypothetical protein
MAISARLAVPAAQLAQNRQCTRRAVWQIILEGSGRIDHLPVLYGLVKDGSATIRAEPTRPDRAGAGNVTRPDVTKLRRVVLSGTPLMCGLQGINYLHFASNFFTRECRIPGCCVKRLFDRIYVNRVCARRVLPIERDLVINDLELNEVG